MVTMLYELTDVLLKVASSTNKTGHYVIATLKNMSVITYNMLTTFLGARRHFQQYVSYNVHCITWRPVLLVLNNTFNNMSSTTHSIVTSFICAECHFQQYVRYYMVTSCIGV
jgi:hypothetical protein